VTWAVVGTATESVTTPRFSRRAPSYQTPEGGWRLRREGLPLAPFATLSVFAVFELLNFAPFWSGLFRPSGLANCADRGF
jgi:hypothetical protein